MSDMSAMADKAKPTVYPVLLAISFAHLVNDSLQAVIPASYPILQQSLGLSYMQLGIITFVLFFSSSVMQPFVGMITDAKPSPRLLPAGMMVALLGMAGLAAADRFAAVLGAVLLVGVASAVYHPEGARIAYMAAGSKRGLAQSIFQVGGNAGSALAPVMTALIFYPFGQMGAMWFTLVAAAGVLVQWRISRWYSGQLLLMPRRPKGPGAVRPHSAIRRRTTFAILIVIVLVFARSWYGAGISNYYAFYLIDRFALSVPESQAYLFLFMAAGIVGTFFGGPLADRFGSKQVILFSLLGSAPFALWLPYANEQLSYVLLFVLGFIQHSSFSVTVVYVQQLLPGKIGTVSGLITGLAFGLGAVGAVVLGGLIDGFGLGQVLMLTAFLPLIGLLGLLLPADRTVRGWAADGERHPSARS